MTGFSGGFVNTYYQKDGPTGTMLSPVFLITRPHINFLIGGGRHPDKTCLNLLVDGKVVRTETGRNQEHLAARSWEVRDLIGREARLQIVDNHGGHWGHVLVDQIVFSDQTSVPMKLDNVWSPPDLDRGLVAHASFDGNLQDGIGGRLLTWHKKGGSKKTDPAFFSGAVGQALRFDGNHVAEFEGLTLGPTNRLTLCGWIHEDGSADWAGLFLDRKGRHKALGLSYAGGSGKLRPRINWFGGSANSWHWDKASPTLPNQWVFIACTLRPDSVTIYRWTAGQGLKQATLEGNFPPHKINQLMLGFDTTDGKRRFKGWMDEVRVYERPLSGEEVLALALLGKEGAATTPKPGSASPVQPPDPKVADPATPDVHKDVVGYWPLAAGFEDRVGDKNATAHGNPTFVKDDKFGRVLSFNGKDQALVIDEYPKIGPQGGAFSAWVWAESHSVWASIAKNWGGPDKRGQFHLGLRLKTGELELQIQDDGQEKIIRDTQPFPLKQWVHVAFTCRLGEQEVVLLKNGVEVGRAALSGSNPPAAPIGSLAIGSKTVDDGTLTAPDQKQQYWHGRMAEIKLYGKAMTVAALQADYRKSRDGVAHREALIAKVADTKNTPKDSTPNKPDPDKLATLRLQQVPADAKPGRVRWRLVGTGNNGDQMRDLKNILNKNARRTVEEKFLDQIGLGRGGKQFVSVIEGILHPPQTGPYTFRLEAHQRAELLVSTDASEANLKLIGDAYKSAKAVGPVSLKAGHGYRFRILHSEHTVGKPKLSLGWTLPGGTTENPIPSKRLSVKPFPSYLVRFINVKPKSAVSAKGTELKVQDDGSVLASGKKPLGDTYTVQYEIPVARLTALRLTALPHESLRDGGPGRGYKGLFTLKEINATVAPLDEPSESRPLVFERLEDDQKQPGFLTEHLIDGKPSVWGSKGRAGIKRILTLIPQEPVESDSGLLLTLTLENHVPLGRFRLAATATADSTVHATPRFVPPPRKKYTRYLNFGYNKPLRVSRQVWEPAVKRVGELDGYTGSGAQAVQKDPSKWSTVSDGLNKSVIAPIRGFQAKVPNGTYKLQFLFADYWSRRSGSRIFSVKAEGKTILSNLDIMKKYGKGKPAVHAAEVKVNDGRLDIVFEAKKGNPLLNALSIEALEMVGGHEPAGNP